MHLYYIQELSIIMIDFQWQNQELSPNRDTVALQSRVLEKEKIKIQIFQKITFFEMVPKYSKIIFLELVFILGRSRAVSTFLGPKYS